MSAGCDVGQGVSRCSEYDHKPHSANHFLAAALKKTREVRTPVNFDGLTGREMWRQFSPKQQLAILSTDCTELIWGLGAFHCLTQQQPAV